MPPIEPSLSESPAMASQAMHTSGGKIMEIGRRQRRFGHHIAAPSVVAPTRETKACTMNTRELISGKRLGCSDRASISPITRCRTITTSRPKCSLKPLL